ncbi:NeuD/PglB/VioB family sugar acetyltransferase [Terrimonas alba]|uniref:NeuD/PglB/VioB family sugar acetyltransferase n=1 Tax=Terrimonas alba TaxID=3349636 RepID=UPI0035F2E28B
MIVVGAKGFAIQLHDVLFRLNETKNLVFYDNITFDLPEKFLDNYEIIRRESAIQLHLTKSYDKRFVLGLGGPSNRENLYYKFRGWGGIPHTVVSKDAIIGAFNVLIGEGTCILANSIIESTVTIGKGTLINIGVLITHNSTIGNFCEIAPTVKILGNSTIGNNVFIGTGAIIFPGLNIGDNSIIGAGSIVTKSVKPLQKVMGIPAKPKK